MTQQQTVTVHVTRRIDAAPERVFDAWLDPGEGGTLLSLSHEGVGAEYQARTEQGWTTILSRIAALVEAAPEA